MSRRRRPQICSPSVEDGEMVEYRNAYQRCGRRNQGFWHLDEAICIDAVRQLFWKEFREGVAHVEEHPLENLPDQVVSIDKAGVRRSVLSGGGHI